jgi:elongation factor P
MLSISDIKLGTVAKIDNEPYVVIWTQHVQMGRGGAILRTKIKNLITGAVLEKTIKGSDKWLAADLERSKASFLYVENNEVYFMDSNSYEQFSLSQENIGALINFLVEGTEVTVLNFESKPVAIQLPTKVKLKVKEAPPGIKGDTAGSATKQITLETGYKINAPLFIKTGDTVIVNTETGQYVERA